jgi:hypothetical protein
MMLKVSWEMICIMVLLRTSVLDSCHIHISMVNFVRCAVLVVITLRVHLLLCAAGLLCE